MSEIISAKQQKVALQLVCHRGHTWASEIDGLNWEGPIFATAFCPTCTLRGERVPFTTEDVDGYLTEEEVGKVGKDAMPVYAYLWSELIQIPPGESKSMTFSLQMLVRAVFDSPGRILQALERLRALKYLNIDEIPKLKTAHRVEYFTDPAERRFVVSFGDKTHLIKLTDGNY